MKPVKFKHSNVVFAEDQPQYQPLPALRLLSNNGEVITCWKMTLKERLLVLFTGRMWISMMTFNKPLTPIYVSPLRSDVYTISKKSKESVKVRIRRVMESNRFLLSYIKGIGTHGE